MKFKLAVEVDIETTPEELIELLKSDADSFAALSTLVKEMNNGNAQAHQ